MAPSALAADLPRSWGLTVALMQGETKAENTMLDHGIGANKWMSTTTLGQTRQAGWLAD